MLELVETKQYAKALSEALERWRESVHPTHAAVVGAIAAKIKLPTLPRGGIQQAWETTKVGDPVMFGALLKALTRSVPIDDKVLPWRPNAGVAAWGKRIARLEKWPDDPRTTIALVGVLQKPPWEMGDPFTGDGLYGRLIQTLVGLRDIRAKPLLERLVAQPTAKTKNLRGYFAATLTNVIETLREPAPLDAASERQCADVLAALGATSPATIEPPIHDDALLEAVLADPDSDAPRAVLGDHWLERGEPRGEVVALQLKARPADLPRVRSLVKHDTWLGADLRRVTKLRTYRRGFLDEITLLGSSVADAASWARAAADPALATVRRLNRGDGTEHYLQAFATSPAMRSLASMPVNRRLLEALATGPTAKQICGLTLDFAPDLDALRLVETSFPALRSLAIVQSSAQLVSLPKLIARWPGRTKLAELGVETSTYRTRTQIVAWLRAQLGVPLFVVHPTQFGQAFAKITMRANELELELDEPDLAVFETIARLGTLRALRVRVVNPKPLTELPRWKAALKKLSPASLVLPVTWRDQLVV